MFWQVFVSSIQQVLLAVVMMQHGNMSAVMKSLYKLLLWIQFL
jgi:hypothetical protein